MNYWIFCENCNKLVFKKRCDKCKLEQEVARAKAANKLRNEKVMILTSKIMKDHKMGSYLLAQIVIDSKLDLETLPADYPIFYFGLTYNTRKKQLPTTGQPSVDGAW